MKPTKVKVTADPAGNVVVPSKNNPDYGYIRVIQVRNVVNGGGFLERKPVSALIQGTISDLRDLGYTENQELDGTIIFEERLTPFNTKEPERDLKIAGETKITCCDLGKPIYRKSFWRKDENAEDILHAHTNGEEIKTAFKAILAARKLVKQTSEKL